MPSATDDLRDAFLIRSLQLNRLAEWERRQVFKIITGIYRESAKLVAAADPGSPEWQTHHKRRLRALIKSIEPVIADGIDAIKAQELDTHTDLVELEIQYTRQVIDGTIGIDGATIAPTVETMSALANDTLVEGATVKEWWDRQKPHIRNGIVDEIRKGVFAQESNNQILQRIRGTRKKNFTDGMIGVTKNTAERIVRTSINSIGNAARNETYQKNADIIKGLQLLATLDTRITKICLSRAGSRWDIRTGKPLPGSPRKEIYPGPPPYHWRCRTVEIPLLYSYEELLGARGAEFDRALEELGPGKRASLDGTVAGNETGQPWFRKQSRERQLKILGPGRLDMFEAGTLKLPEMIDQRGFPLSIDELKEAA